RVRPHRWHIDDGWRLPCHLEPNDCLVEQSSKRDHPGALQHKESLDLPQMKVLPARYAGARSRAEHKRLAAMALKTLEEIATEVRSQGRADGVVVRKAKGAVCVEERPVQRQADVGDLAG